jgi:hypothetical protein
MRFMGAQLAGFIAHVSWRPGEGWRVWVTTWEEGQTPPKGRQDEYRRLTADEAQDVLAAEMVTRCEWLTP